MISIPSQENKQIIQTNNGDILGTLFASRNLNLDKKGLIALAKRTKFVTQHLTSGTKLGTLLNIVNNVAANEYVAVGDGGTYTSDGYLNVTTWTRDSGTNAPGAGFDVIYFNGRCYNLSSTSIKYKTTGGATGTWTTSAVSASTTNIHTACINDKKNLLHFTDGNVLRSINTSDAAGVTITVPARYIMTSVVFSNDRVFIGCSDTSGLDGKVFVWDGVASEVTAAYSVNAQGVVSMCKYQSGVAILNSVGQLMASNGGGFTELAALPVYYEDESPYTAYTSHHYTGVPHCMASIGDIIFINVSDLIVGSSRSGIPYAFAGIWCFDPAVGLYHRYAPSVYQDTTDYGQGQYYFYPGGAVVFLTEPASTTGVVPTLANASEIFFGGSCLKEGGLINYSSVCSVTSGDNRGYFVTNKIISSEVTDLYQKVYIKFRGVIDAGDKIYIYKKTTERGGLPFVSGTVGNADITWTSDRYKFTTTTTDFADVIAGDSVEVLSGKGAGQSSTIVSISESSGTYTVILEDIIGGTSGDKGTVLVDSWTLLGSVTNSDTNGYKEFSIGSAYKSIQFKVEMRGEDVAIEEMQIINATHKPSL